ncbi:MAG: ATP-binding protein [Treponema sp.]|uniref:ATP-binding protein n=1 Tax=Treponema sp. TaxID=166 RepID=UPI0025EF9CC5|nr:AAA family ATPase [Treponema sp.]MBQ9281791.1 ATP-binding protein [Treponema sp.]MBR1722697.1 ATP-binding protein [Treponema sp.]
MYRKAYQELLNWKNEEKGKCAIMIDGARRIGKSYLALEFAKNEYDSYILIDFYAAPYEVKEIFEKYLSDLDTFFLRISAYYSVNLYERKTLFIFDEVQFFPRARAAIKYLVADGRYDFIETGSLLSISKNTQDILIPSEERHLKINPMDFEEFLLALGNESLLPVLKDSFEKKLPLGQALHRKAMDLFRLYLIVGGMPQAVKEYVESKDFERVDRIKREILELYRNDIKKHAKGSELKAEAIFDEIPAQLSKHEKKFKISSLKKEARMRDYDDAFMWLNDSRIVNICYNADEPNIALKMNMTRASLKCYLADTGLLISHAFDENGIVSEEIYKKLLFGKLEVNEGMIFENIAAQMLTASGHKLYFYSKSDNEDASSRMEVDFLITKNKVTARHNIQGIEVKSTKRYTLTSLNKFREKYEEYAGSCFVLHTADFREENGIIYLPVYMTMFL